jgi:hypothetical protein
MENHVVRNCIADMPKDVKQKVVDHAHIATASPGEAMPDELFAYASDEAHDNLLCESITYGSRKQGKLKPGDEEFAW